MNFGFAFSAARAQLARRSDEELGSGDVIGFGRKVSV